MLGAKLIYIFLPPLPIAVRILLLLKPFDATFPPKEKKWMPSQEEFYIYSHSSVVR